MNRHIYEDAEDDYDCIPGLDYPYDTDEDERLVLDCGLPGCVMPGYHFPSECHTAEMIEAWEAEAERQARGN